MSAIGKGLLVERRNDLATIFGIVAVFIFAVVYSVFSATTVSTDVTTDGNVYATSTVQATGKALFYSSVGVGGTTSPYQEVSITGDVAVGSDATTTVSAESTSATAAACIELKDSTRGRWIRIYPGAVATSTAGNTKTGQGGVNSNQGVGLLAVEEGRCQ